GVVLLPQLATGRDELRLSDLEAARLDPAENLAGEPALHGVRLDQDEAALEGHVSVWYLHAAAAECRAPAWLQAPRARSASRNTGRPARSGRAAPRSSRTPA